MLYACYGNDYYYGSCFSLAAFYSSLALLFTIEKTQAVSDSGGGEKLKVKPIGRCSGNERERKSWVNEPKVAGRLAQQVNNDDNWDNIP